MCNVNGPIACQHCVVLVRLQTAARTIQGCTCPGMCNVEWADGHAWATHSTLLCCFTAVAVLQELLQHTV